MTVISRREHRLAEVGAFSSESGSNAVALVADSVSKVFSQGKGDLPAVSDITMSLRRGEFCSLIGPSGCGKSTFLRMVANLDVPSSGSISLYPERAGHAHSAVAFQEYSIFPWKTVLENISFGLRMHGVKRSEARERARHWVERMGLEGFEDKYPHMLSGGMKQRVSLARALAVDPELLLLDEPFAALDAQLRQIFQEDLLALWEAEERRTAIFVTHSIDEAILLSDRIVLLSARPARVKREWQVPFSRPRLPSLRNLPEFAALRAEIWEELRVEVQRSGAATGDNAEQPSTKTSEG